MRDRIPVRTDLHFAQLDYSWEGADRERTVLRGGQARLPRASFPSSTDPLTASGPAE